jgi:outer membrane lipase/esterase
MIDGPHQYSLLAESLLHTRAGHLRTLNDGLMLARSRPEGERWNVFVAIDHGIFQIDDEPGVQGLKNTANSGSVGVTTNLSEAVTLGIAAGQSKSRNQFVRGTGNYNTNEKIISLFGSVKMAGFYGTGVVSISDVTFGEIRRNIVLGPMVRTANANAEGSNASASFNAGYDFRFRALTIGPTVGVTTQHVTVNQFDETDAGSSNLRIAEQTRRSEVWSVGARATLDLGEGWTPWVRVTADKERRDDARVITATPLSLATANSYDIPAYMPDTSYVTMAVGIRGQIDRLGVGLSYSTVTGRSGIRDDGVSLLLSYRF